MFLSYLESKGIENSDNISGIIANITLAELNVVSIIQLLSSNEEFKSLIDRTDLASMRFAVDVLQIHGRFLTKSQLKELIEAIKGKDYKITHVINSLS